MKPQTSLLVLLHMFHALFSISETPSIHVLIKQENMKKEEKKKHLSFLYFHIILQIGWKFCFILPKPGSQNLGTKAFVDIVCAEWTPSFNYSPMTTIEPWLSKQPQHYWIILCPWDRQGFCFYAFAPIKP